MARVKQVSRRMLRSGSGLASRGASHATSTYSSSTTSRIKDEKASKQPSKSSRVSQRKKQTRSGRSSTATAVPSASQENEPGASKSSTKDSSTRGLDGQDSELQASTVPPIEIRRTLSGRTAHGNYAYRDQGDEDDSDISRDESAEHDNETQTTEKSKGKKRASSTDSEYQE